MQPALMTILSEPASFRLGRHCVHTTVLAYVNVSNPPRACSDVPVTANLSQDCTHIVVKVVFPGCRLRDLEVDVTNGNILAASPKL